MNLSFREIEPEDAEIILHWRTSPRVAKFMKTVVDHGVEEQRQWILNCRKRPDFYHWLIQDQGEDIGYISLTDYDPINKTASWGFYIGDDERVRLGGWVPPPFYHFCFTHLGIERLNAEMLHFNSSVIELHRLHGYSFMPHRDRILNRAGKDFLLIAMSLDKGIFLAGKFARFQADFPTDHWKPGLEESIDIADLRFEEVSGTPEQIEILLDLLRKRKHSISHERIPDPKDHAEFVANHPYRIWWLVRSEERVIGAAYLSIDNALGIQLTADEPKSYQTVIEKIRSENRPLPAIPSVRPGFLYVNVAPDNRSLNQALLELGAKQTQSSFRLPYKDFS
jgi:UDP-4-amino-4,6-dideoxy-N-acetyl-beta-L-altrosamine N-acetyltransferase